MKVVPKIGGSSVAATVVEAGYDSDESSKLFDDGSPDSPASSKSRRKPVSKLVQQRNEIRAKVVKDVMDLVMPDIGSFDVDGSTQRRKENDAGAIVVRWLKFLGIIDMDLHDAVLTGSINKVRGSLRKIRETEPALVNQYDENGYTALSLAVKINNSDITECLLESGAQPDMVDEVSGRTPLFFSVHQHNHSISNLLIRNGASVNMTDFKSISPLMIATGSDDLKHVELLVDKFAELDAQDENGWTALHYGAMTNAFKCVRFLVAEGADMSLKDLNKRRALHLARFKEHGETIAALSQQVRLG